MTTSKKAFLIRIDPALYRALERAADQERPTVSINYLIERTLTERYLPQRKKERTDK